MTDDWTLADHIEAIASILTDDGTCPTLPLDVNSGLIMNMLDAAAELRRLERWKSEALIVLAEWGKVHEALGSPGRLGEVSKAKASLAEVKRLKQEVKDLRDANAKRARDNKWPTVL